VHCTIVTTLDASTPISSSLSSIRTRFWLTKISVIEQPDHPQPST
jgi:hypothetical protein